MPYTSPVLLILFVFTALKINTQPQVTITLLPDQQSDTISRHIYGHFSEHLGRCIYDGLYVGETNTIIPNTAGVRNDIIAALKELNIPNLRWPGGCFADTYHWKDGVGPRSERPTIVNRWWGGVTEDNSFGTHDFLNLCERLDAEPYLSANVGSGTVQELIDWVQYTNHGERSPMADWRRANGRQDPWQVKFWGIGNETWGCGGNMRAEYYADIYRQYATFVDGWSGDLSITRIASGASGDDYHWTETLMKQVPHRLMEAVALHHYSVFDWSDKGPSVNYDEAIYFKSMQQALKMEELVTRHIAIMDKYDPDNKVDLYVDEWGGWYDTEPEWNRGVLFQQSTMRDALIAATSLNTFNNHARRIKMANIAQVVNVLQAVILTEGEKIVLTPTYHVMHMYKVHHDAVLVPTVMDNISYTYEGKRLPALSVSASRDAGGTVHVSIANIDAHQAIPIKLAWNGIAPAGVSARILAADRLQAHNTFTEPDRIRPGDFDAVSWDAEKAQLVIPAHSVILLAIR